ncbi:hypothetical protein CR205_19365 [Alteribacter lacisalsi]|uniref:NYN domain-containing protein n=1 Tax=Alteribacter lacisalsi TaxID=2045244 RepID=A0A2W0H1K2_9BACI|nr:NYN domain-containing protein [Alteribacter lacisalsi]PYZ95673.1 hypothetical protein CR205_19365 [Alteribacter lacisalsi]
MRRFLIVDGYNIIGDWQELRELQARNLEEARDVLIEKMAEYQAYTGTSVIIVFDAHMVPGLGRKMKNYRLDIIYTREKETADERIEKLVRTLKRVDTEISVATSDFVEQRIIFASGALRKSARELRNEVKTIEKGIAKKVLSAKKQTARTKLPMTEEMADIFEKWRRGER